MSYEAVFNGGKDGDAIYFASTVGTGDFMRWAKDLDDEDYPDLVEFAENYEADNLRFLRHQIGHALRVNPPTVDGVEETARDFAKALKGRDDSETVKISDGVNS